MSIEPLKTTVNERVIIFPILHIFMACNKFIMKFNRKFSAINAAFKTVF